MCEMVYFRGWWNFILVFGAKNLRYISLVLTNEGLQLCCIIFQLKLSCLMISYFPVCVCFCYVYFI